MAAWPFLRALIPHAEAVADRYPAGEEPATLGPVLSTIALFHQSQGSFQDALRLRVTAPDLAQRVHGDSLRETAICLGNLARSYGALGRHAEALPLEERALAVMEAALGPDHPDATVYRSNLAVTYRAVGRDADAATLERRASQGSA